jgi:hypothetical protein
MKLVPGKDEFSVEVKPERKELTLILRCGIILLVTIGSTNIKDFDVNG